MGGGISIITFITSLLKLIIKKILLIGQFISE